MTEIWKDIEGYDHKYQVSNLGRVRSVYHVDELGRFQKGKILKPRPVKGGYLSRHIRKYKDIKVHRAVALAFVPGYFEGAEVNHIDENRQNNRWDNLEWVTSKQNANHGTRNEKLRKIGEDKFGKPTEQYSPEGELISILPSESAAARVAGVTVRRIQKVLDTNQKAGGYFFKRAKPKTPTP